MTEYMMDPVISNLVKTVPRLDRLIAAQRARCHFASRETCAAVKARGGVGGENRIRTTAV